MIDDGKIFDIDITDFGVNGEGVGKAENFVVFVRGAVPGDRARVELCNIKKSHCSGRLIDIIKPSPQREESVCDSFNLCGGCAFLHINYETELRFKKKKVNDALKRIGGLDFEITQIISDDNPYHYRNKAIYHVSRQNGKTAIGFYAAKSNQIVSANNCVTVSPSNKKIIDAIKAYMEKNNVPPYDYVAKSGVIKAVMIRQSSSNKKMLVCILTATNKLPNTSELIRGLTADLGGDEFVSGIALSISNSRGRESFGDHTVFIWGEHVITDSICGLNFNISPASFFQVNTSMASRLYDKALELCRISECDTVVDAYCGTGTLALLAAKRAKSVIGIELVEQAINDARKNAKKNKITNATFICGDTADVLGQLDCTALILDPPRGGCGKRALAAIEKLGADRIVYISCDPATLARDLKIITGCGYRVREGACFDMFARCAHVETVVSMSRVYSNSL